MLLLAVLIAACQKRPVPGGGQRSPTELENTYWKLVRLGDKRVSVVENRPEPHLRLVAQERKVQGSAGCNTFGGQYQLEGENLRLGPVVTTRMACSQGMEQEQEFYQALEATAKWKVAGEHLELYGSGGELLASFEARHMER